MADIIDTITETNNTEEQYVDDEQYPTEDTVETTPEYEDDVLLAGYDAMTAEEKAEELKRVISSIYDSLVVLKSLKDYTELTEDLEEQKRANEGHIQICLKQYSDIPDDIVALANDVDSFDPDGVIWKTYRETEDPASIIVFPELSPEAILSRKKNKLYEDLKNTYEFKLKEGYDIITNTLISDKVIREYEIKERKAREAIEKDDYSFFDEVASIVKMTSKEYAELIVSKADQWHSIEDKIVLKFGEFRGTIEDYLENDDIDNAETSLNQFNNFDTLEFITK